MRKNCVKVILLVIALTMAVVSTASAMPRGYVRIGKNNIKAPVNVRIEPSMEAEVMEVLKPNDFVKVERIDKNGWYEIVSRGRKGFVLAKYLDTDLKSRFQSIGKFRTYFDFTNSNRTHNIILASEKVSIKIPPGQLFKWSDVVGSASAEQGYLPANVIINNEMVQGYGGGVCQVTSTIYNAVLEAGLEIIERHPHGLPVNYVPEGKDATVAHGYLDFIFKNNYYFPIQIIAFVGYEDVGFVEVEIFKVESFRRIQLKNGRSFVIEY